MSFYTKSSFFPFLFFVLALQGTVCAVNSSPPRTSRNIILITIDTVRADHLGCYGYDHIRTSTLDGLARDGVVFDRAISQVPLTWPSHAVILTGTYPFQNGVQDFTGQPLAPQFRSVAQAFRRSGYVTGAVVSAFVLDRSWGLARGFDFYDDSFAPGTSANGLVERNAAESVKHAISWLQPNRRPFFLWLHLYDPHSPYNPPEPYRSEYRNNLYDGEIAYADHELEGLISWLKQKKLYEESAIVVLSDHGESLGEHGEREHGFFVYNSTIHVPLIVKPPASSGIFPHRVPTPVETTAVAATLLDLAGVRDSISRQFQSPGLFDPHAPNSDDNYSETFYPFNSFGWSPLHALETKRFHYIDAPIAELYDLTTDPGETRNLASELRATAAILKERLQKFRARNPFTITSQATPAVSQDASEKLRALGYVAYRAPVPNEALTSLADPKDKVEEFNAILRAADAFHAADYATGEALLRHVRETDPAMYIVPFYLGEAALSQQKWEEASSEFKKCLALNPNFDQAMTGLARALMYQGKSDEARQWAENALKFNPQNYRAWYEVGFISAGSDQAAAAAAYEKAVSIEGNFAPLRRDLGLLYFQRKQYLQASRHLAKAVDLGLQSPLIYNSLGISYSRTQRIQKAIDSYKEALRLDPTFAEAHMNLASAYQRANQYKEAARELRNACDLRKDFCELVPDSASKLTAH